jgi:Protein of unknown function (DUF2950)
MRDTYTMNTSSNNTSFTNTAFTNTAFRRHLGSMLAPVALALFVLGHAQPAAAQQPQPKTFSSPAEASRALLQAVQNHDEAAIEAILGTGKDVTSTGDESADKLEHERFVQKYQEMHRLVQEPDGTTVLYIGAENWPFPIPLASGNGGWRFDSKTGSQEILFRRIGENEATAVEVCRTLVETKQEERQTESDPIREYAQTLVSGQPGNAGPNAGGSADNEPFHGYYFRAVDDQAGKTTVGTTGSRASGTKTSARAAFVAYPVEYRSSGVMTFIVTKDGAVYERDLGPETAARARDIQGRSPASAWAAVK